MTFLARYTPWMLGLLRIVSALAYMEHGTQKLFQFPPMRSFGGGGPGGAGGPPEMPAYMATLFLAAGIIETFGGLAILVGLFTRPVAFIVAGELAVVYWWMHVPRGGIFPIGNGGEAVVLYCFVFLYLVFAGPGAFAVDGLFRRRTA